MLSRSLVISSTKHGAKHGTKPLSCTHGYPAPCVEVRSLAAVQRIALPSSIQAVDILSCFLPEFLT